jgi:sugar/nucleoside kinase (ribokinase family)
MSLPTAVVAGHICLDLIPDMGALEADRFHETFQPGHLIEVGSATMSTGGAVSNTGLALHLLGIPTWLIGKIGTDPFGQIVRRLVESYDPHLAEKMVVDPLASTSYTVIVNPPGVDRLFLHSPGANHSFSADDIDYDLVSQAALFHFGYPPIMRRMYTSGGRELVELFKRVKNTGVTTSLDLCYVDPATEAGKANWAEILKAVLPFVDIFLPSFEELLWMLHFDEFEKLSRLGRLLDQAHPTMLHDVSDELLQLGVRFAVIKLGEHGLYLRTAHETALSGMGRARPPDQVAWANVEYWAPCFRVRVIGTTGAGDATIAGFLAALLRGLTPSETITAAVAIGACNVEAADALSGLRSWDETIRRVRAGWERLPLILDDPAWEWDEIYQLWRAKR